MDDLISRAALLAECAERQKSNPLEDGRGWADHFLNDAQYPSTEWKSVEEMIEYAPAVDAVSVVRCKDCKYRIVNEHYGEKGYMALKAICKEDTGDPFQLGRNAEDDDWYCADGERRDENADD